MVGQRVSRMHDNMSGRLGVSHDVGPAGVRLRAFEVGEAEVRPPWGVSRPPGGWDVHFYLLRGAPCRFLPDRSPSVELRKLSICMVNGRSGHSFQDEYCSPIDQVALPMPSGTRPLFRAKSYGGASGQATSSFYIGGALERANSLSELDIPPLVILEFESPPDWLFAGVSLIRQEMGGDHVDAATAARLCEYLFSKTIQEHRSRTAPHLRPAGRFRAVDRRLHRALRIIDADIGHPWTLEALAESIGMSRSRLTARWHEEMGISVFDYISQRRMEKAAAMLSETRLDVGTIAHRVGYASHAAFSTAFKRAWSQSPVEFRKSGGAPLLPPLSGGQA